MDEQRSFFNPNEEEDQYNNNYQSNPNNYNYQYNDQHYENNHNHNENADLISGYSILMPEQDLEETNTNVRDCFLTAESEIVVASAHMLQTIREVAEEMLATAVIPFRNEAPTFCYSDFEIKARQRLEKLGLSEYQIAKLIEYEVKNQNPHKARESKSTKNLVYAAEAQKKAKRGHQIHHHVRMARPK